MNKIIKYLVCVIVVIPSAAPLKVEASLPGSSLDVDVTVKKAEVICIGTFETIDLPMSVPEQKGKYYYDDNQVHVIGLLKGHINKKIAVTFSAFKSEEIPNTSTQYILFIKALLSKTGFLKRGNLKG